MNSVSPGLVGRIWPRLRRGMVDAGLGELLLRLNVLGLVETRRKLAFQHIAPGSCGLEIGALHAPLPLPPGAHACYVDKHCVDTLRTLRADAATTLVIPDLLADGLRLHCIAAESQDFVIANHLLEHAQDTLGTLCNWLHVLRPGGTLFIAVPIGARCFDRGRPLTTNEHFLADYELTLAGDTAAMRQRNLAHVEEHLAISAPAIAALQGQSWVPPGDGERQRLITHFLDHNPEQIHHHVFSRTSLGELLHLLCRVVGGACRVERVAASRVEALAIVRRLR
ncbi:MAG: class I SAM-dependent methyltransferase [Dechloromonas sp.]|nr:MAG: class I SAM-dependent methyltransferase [Dechloromonas sp.]